MIDLTVCLLNWKRQDNLDKILDFLYGNVKIFLWDNYGNLPKDYRVDWQVTSSKNKRCCPRWWMLQQAETEFVCCMDDDLLLKDINSFVDMINVMKMNPEYSAIGAFGKNKEHIIQEYKKWKYITNVDNDTIVDILLGRLILTKKEYIKNAIINESEDDICLSWLLTENKKQKLLVPKILKDQIVELPDNFALWRQEGHFKRREEAVNKYYFIKYRYQLKDLLDNDIVGCELGVFEGDFSQTLLNTKKFKKLFLVDIFSGRIQVSQEKVYEDGSVLFYKVKNRFDRYPEVSVFKQDSVDFLNSMEESSLDFVYIDTEHTYEQLSSELEAARKSVKNNGFICGHDYAENKFPGVCKAVNEFTRKYDLSFKITQEPIYKSFFILNNK